MAMNAAPARVLPKFSLVSEYSVRRVGKFPSVSVRYVECNYLLTAPLTISAQIDADVDGAYEEITVQDVASLGISNPVGHLVSDLDSNALATIVATEQIVAVPAVMDGPNVLTPAQYATKLTLSPGLTEEQMTKPVAIVDRMPVGTNAYQPVTNGRNWETTLFGANQLAMQEMGNLLGGAYFQAAKAILTKLGLTDITDAQILGAVQALGAEGTNLDGFLAQQGEALELKRQNGQLPFASVMGAP